MTSEITNINPLGDIAVCMSGGGYRAAAYHLGTLKMLNELNLLSDVKYLSTASGGTILAMKYVVSKIDKVPFKTFEEEMCKFLTDINVVDEAFKILETVKCSDGTNNLSLIRSAAEIYRQKLVPEKTLGNLIDHVGDEKPFMDLIFNATEFRGGNGFRFRVSKLKNITIGNGNMNINPELAKQISLADVVAASSCFPGAFEPMCFPRDFIFQDRELTKIPFLPNRFEAEAGTSEKENPVKMVALMDGGIYDNQGLDGMTVSYTKEKVPFDLILISDTNARDDEFLSYNLDEKQQAWRIKNFFWNSIKNWKFKYLVWILAAFLILLLICSASLIIKIFNSFRDSHLPLSDFMITTFSQMWVLYFVSLVLLVFSGVSLYLIFWGYRKLKSFPVTGANFAIWDYLKNLKLFNVKNLITERLDSVAAMTFNVFMKRIRSLTFAQTNQLTDKNTRNNLFQKKVAFDLIYDLDSHFEKSLAAPPELQISEKLKCLSNDAENLGTTLWFGNSEDVNILVNCGRASTCFSLLRYLRKNFKKEINDPNSAYKTQYDRILNKWIEIKAELESYRCREKPQGDLVN